jgi:hypothetical protein
MLRTLADKKVVHLSVNIAIIALRIEISHDNSIITLRDQGERSTCVDDNLLGPNRQVLTIKFNTIKFESPPELICQVVPLQGLILFSKTFNIIATNCNG